MPTGELSQQPMLDGMPRRLYSCTPTRLTSWLDCPRRYRFSYLDRPRPVKGPPWAHQSLGSAIHLALAGWWRVPLRERTPARAGELLDAEWQPRGFRDPAQAEWWRTRARAMVSRYVTDLDPEDEPCGVERTVAARTDALAFSGRVDRLDRRPFGAGADPDAGEQIVIVDYKTGQRELTTDDARNSLALALYAVAAERMLRRRSSRVELHHVPTGRILAHEHSPESRARHLRRAESAGIDAAGADRAHARGLSATRNDELFAPRPGPQCGWCDYAAHCPEGRAAARTRAPWEGLPG